LQNAARGVRRALARLRIATASDPSTRRSRGTAGTIVGIAEGLARTVGLTGRRSSERTRPARRASRARRALTTRFATGQVLPIGVGLVVLLASVVSLGPASASAGAAGPAANTDTRIAVGGGYDSVEVAGLLGGLGTRSDSASFAPVDDGTVWKPVAVDTSIQDGKSVMRYYTVQTGDTLTGIASRFGVSMMTIWWANNLTTKDSLKVGQTLMVPPVTGLTITVKAGDTIDGLATKYKADPQSILDANQLTDPTLIVGQTLIVPDAAGAPIPTPTPKKTTGGSCTTCTYTYTGGAWAWPVAGWNYISQYFHSGHDGIDIASKYGTPIVSPLGGTIVFTGWYGGGGGYQVWINHGNGLYTVHLHMSAILVSVGQKVAKGQQIGRVGMTGNATGPHDHFGVSIGWPYRYGSYFVNPLRYY
jgi:murein DD-endopeptidase MepM/ murein hydrolase activator NlpD